MPVPFGSILGNVVTLIGTPPKIIIASYREYISGEPFQFELQTPSFRPEFMLLKTRKIEEYFWLQILEMSFWLLLESLLPTCLTWFYKRGETCFLRSFFVFALKLSPKISFLIRLALEAFNLGLIVLWPWFVCLQCCNVLVSLHAVFVGIFRSLSFCFISVLFHPVVCLCGFARGEGSLSFAFRSAWADF